MGRCTRMESNSSSMGNQNQLLVENKLELTTIEQFLSNLSKYQKSSARNCSQTMMVKIDRFNSSKKMARELKVGRMILALLNYQRWASTLTCSLHSKAERWTSPTATKLLASQWRKTLRATSSGLTSRHGNHPAEHEQTHSTFNLSIINLINLV